MKPGQAYVFVSYSFRKVAGAVAKYGAFQVTVTGVNVPFVPGDAVWFVFPVIVIGAPVHEAFVVTT